MENTTTPQAAPERELPALAAIAGLFRWLEEFLAIVSGPLLTAGLLIALVDLLTDGKLLATQPELLYTWAIAMGAGLDAQLVGTSAKLGRAARQGKGWRVLGNAALVLLLAYVAFVAAQVFATQQADGISTSQALYRLGMDSTTWLIQRSALSVFLVILSGITRYSAPLARAQDTSVAAIHSQQQLGLARIHKWRSYAQAALAREGDAATLPERPPTGPGTPTIAPLPQSAAEDTGMLPNVASVRIARRIPATRLAALRQDARYEGYRARGFDILEREPAITVTDLGKAIGCRTATAGAIRWDWQHQRRAAVR